MTFSEKNLTLKRSAIRWKLSYLMLLLLSVWLTWALVAPLFDRNWARVFVAELGVSFDWDYARASFNAVVAWLTVYLGAASLWNVWCLYGLMGVHLKPQGNKPVIVAKQARTPGRKTAS